MRRAIIYFHNGHPNDSESLAYQRETFNMLGYTIIDFSISSPSIANELTNVLVTRSPEVAFFLSSNYYGAKISNSQGQLLHTMTGIPLVIMHHDHPLYFLNQQSSQLNGSITFTIGDESVDFIEKFYNIETACVTRSGARPVGGKRIPTYDSFMAKENLILCPMNLAVNGMGLDTLWQLIKQLPLARRTAAIELAEIAMSDCTRPLHEIANSRRLPDSSYSKEMLEDQLLVLNFIKGWRRNSMIRELIDLPILISSEYVPADLDFKYSKKFTLFSRKQTMALYEKYRFILNCNPVMMDVLHERVLEAIYANSVVVSDKNRTINRYLRDDHDYIALSFGVDSMADKLSAYLDDPHKAFALTEHAHERIIGSRDFGLIDSYSHLIDVIEARWTEKTL